MVLSADEIRVERDGLPDVSPCRFLLIATLNSQLGQIRKSLVDHFGLYAKAEADQSPQGRKHIMLRPAAFAADGRIRRMRLPI